MRAEVPILKIGEFLVVTIQTDMHDQMAMQLREDLALSVQTNNASGVVIDISALNIVDSYIARLLNSIASITKLLGAETVVVGMQPMVAITLVELGLKLPDILTALDLEKGLSKLQERLSVVH